MPVTVWWEAENPTTTNYPKANPFAPGDSEQKKLLSGGAWIGASSPGTRYFATYAVEVPASQTYSFYVRKFWKHGPFRYRFDTQPWQTVSRDTALLDDISLRRHVSVSWVPAGSVVLEAGTRTLHVELTGDDSNGASAWDAFVLTTADQGPSGLLRPGSITGSSKTGYFAFTPGAVTSEARALDLRHLNERRAGELGFVVVRGATFVRENSLEPLRFWGVNATSGALGLPRALKQRYAEELAARGVNLVRVHTPLWQSEDIRQLDADKLHALHELVAALADQGIYTALSLYFPVWLRPGKKNGFSGYDGESPALSLLYFNRNLETIYRGWWSQLLTTPNPHTGKALGRDPAVALVELLNEDSTLFWSFKPYEALPEAHTILAEREFGRFLSARHGSVANALAAWGGSPVRGDDAASGRAGIMRLHDIIRQTTRRTRETAEFLATVMRDLHARTHAYLRNELGVRAPIVCSNWITADATRLGPLDKWANTACDVMDRHGYYGGPHEGDGAGYRLLPGHTYADASALRFDPTTTESDDERHDLPIMNVRYAGQPSIVSEINWPMPNRFRAELVPLVMAYGSLQGTSAFLFFADDAPGFAGTLTKFSVADPVVLGQFPAAALAYRRGYVTEGPPVVSAALAVSELFALKGGLAQPENLDSFRRQKAADEPRQPSTLDPFAFLVGRVDVSFTTDAPRRSFVDLTKFVDRKQQVVVSSTGELRWAWDPGVVTVRAARVEGAAGFLARSASLSLGVLSIETTLEYGAVLLVSLDGNPLAESKDMLLQLSSEVTNHGFRSSDGATRTIESVGSPPLLVKHLEGTVHLRRSDATTLNVTALDPHGRPTHVWQRPGSTFPLLPGALYYRVTRPAE